jgi:hypothetical protein
MNEGHPKVILSGLEMLVVELDYVPDSKVLSFIHV